MPEGGAGKFERIEHISEDPRLKRHRFLLSERPELREKLHILQDSLAQLQKQYPEIITLQVLGSHTKGYADDSSDFDLSLPLDAHKLETARRAAVDVANTVRWHIAQALNVPYDRISIDFYELGGQYDHPRYEAFLMSLGNGLRPYREAMLKELESKPLGDGAWRGLVEKLWERENLYFDGALMQERKKLYPQTLAEARAYFLPEPKNGS